MLIERLNLSLWVRMPHCGNPQLTTLWAAYIIPSYNINLPDKPCTIGNHNWSALSFSLRVNLVKKKWNRHTLHRSNKIQKAHPGRAPKARTGVMRLLNSHSTLPAKVSTARPPSSQLDWFISWELANTLLQLPGPVVSFQSESCTSLNSCLRKPRQTEQIVSLSRRSKLN